MTVLVVGAVRGIGNEFAKRLVSLGCTLYQSEAAEDLTMCHMAWWCGM